MDQMRRRVRTPDFDLPCNLAHVPSVVPLTVLDNGVGFGGALDFGEDILCRSCPDKGLGRLVARFQVGPEPEFASWAAICDGMKWPPAGSSLLTSRFGASSRHFSLLQKRILSMKRHRDEHDLGERWSWTHDEFDLLRNRTDSGPITT